MTNTKATILIVEDEKIYIDMLAGILPDKYSVAIAKSGEQALKRLQSVNLPDLILLDVMMPDMDGFEVCNNLKKNPDTKDIPIIFLTAKNDPEDIIKGFEVGGVDYVLKPFNSSELLRRISTHIELQHNRRMLMKRNEIQSELLHVISHDLANSLGTILGFSKCTQTKPDESSRLIPHIISNAENALEILKLSKMLLVAEEKQLDTAPVNLKSILDQSARFIHTRLEEKNILLNITVPEHTIVIAEEVSLINSVLINLLSNAIKFSHPESAIKIYSHQDETDKVKVTISDSGIGMPPELVNDLFDLSRCISRPGTEGEEGTGFGMPLVKKFMNKYEGDIVVSSKSIEDFPNDHGTEITLIFKCG